MPSRQLFGPVNSEFQGDVTRKIRLGAVDRLHGDSAWEVSGGKVREWARTKGFKVTSAAGGDPPNNSRTERCAVVLKRMGRTMLLGSDVPNCSDLWPLAQHTCGIWPQVFRTRLESVDATLGCESVFQDQRSSK